MIEDRTNPPPGTRVVPSVEFQGQQIGIGSSIRFLANFGDGLDHGTIHPVVGVVLAACSTDPPMACFQGTAGDVWFFMYESDMEIAPAPTAATAETTGGLLLEIEGHVACHVQELPLRHATDDADKAPSWFAFRGSTVRCVEPDNGRVSHNKEYVVLSHWKLNESDTMGFFQVIDNKGEATLFTHTRFVWVKDADPKVRKREDLALAIFQYAHIVKMTEDRRSEVASLVTKDGMRILDVARIRLPKSVFIDVINDICRQVQTSDKPVNPAKYFTALEQADARPSEDDPDSSPTPTSQAGDSAVSKTAPVSKTVGDEDLVKYKDVEIVRTGNKVVIPEKMGLREAAKWMSKKADEDDQVVRIFHEIPCFPLDGALALIRAMREMFGWTSLVPTPGFFGPTPPTMVSCPVSPTETVQVPWGRIEVPTIEGYLQTGLQPTAPIFIIQGEVKRKNEKRVQELCDRVRQLITSESIYKGKAIRLDLSYMRDKNVPFDLSKHSPTFIDLPTDPKVILTAETEGALNSKLWMHIEHSQACRDNKIGLKRGILLYGPYGTGKTLIATVTAVKAIKNGWTYIQVPDTRDLANALKFAQLYCPVVVFAEDIDRVVGPDRSISVDDILNTIDGVDTKNKEIITVLTTNHVEQINKAMLRPGRTNPIEIGLPNAAAREGLIHLYGRSIIEPGTDLRGAVKALDGMIPAMIQEVVETAKSQTIVRLQGQSDIEGLVSGEDIRLTAEATRAHMALLAEKEPDRRSPATQMGAAMGEVIASAINNTRWSANGREALGTEGDEGDYTETPPVLIGSFPTQD